MVANGPVIETEIYVAYFAIADASLAACVHLLLTRFQVPNDYTEKMPPPKGCDRDVGLNGDGGTGSSKYFWGPVANCDQVFWLGNIVPGGPLPGCVCPLTVAMQSFIFYMMARGPMGVRRKSYSCKSIYCLYLGGCCK